MVLTRRQTATKITFPEDGEDETSINLQAENGSEESEQEQPNEDESDSDSDSDEAPEEESTGAAKSEILEKEKQRKESEQEKKRIEREKRRQQDAYNQQQQQLKRENEEKARAKESQQQQQDNLPELLPSDIIEAANNTSLSKDKTITGKHTILEDMDLTMKKQIKLERLKQLKRLNKPEVKKGPVSVKVLNTHNKNKVPKSESKIIGAKDKWLKRKSLNKK